MSIVLMNWVYISDEVAADADYFVTAARPNTDATMANTGAVSVVKIQGQAVSATAATNDLSNLLTR